MWSVIWLVMWGVRWFDVIRDSHVLEHRYFLTRQPLHRISVMTHRYHGLAPVMTCDKSWPTASVYCVLWLTLSLASAPCLNNELLAFVYTTLAYLLWQWPLHNLWVTMAYLLYRILSCAAFQRPRLPPWSKPAAKCRDLLLKHVATRTESPL